MIVKPGPNLSLSNTFGSRVSDAGGLLKPGDIAFERGRDAIYQILQHLKTTGVKKVLIPATICAAVIDPIASAGMSTITYRLAKDLSPDLDDISTKLEQTDTAVLAVQYFGFLNDLNELRSICDDAGAVLIEDCALSLYGSIDGNPVGSQGHASIFSWRKFLPVPDGGVLRINDQRLATATAHAPSRALKPTSATRYLIKSALTSIALSRIAPSTRLAKSLLREVTRQEPFNLTDDFETSDGSAALSNWIITHTNHHNIISRRRDNAKFWIEWANNTAEVKLLRPHLAKGDVPYGMPILVDDADRIVRLLQRQGIILEAPINRPYYESPILDNQNERFGGIEELARRVVLLPTHQSINNRQLSNITSRFEEIFRD